MVKSKSTGFVLVDGETLTPENVFDVAVNFAEVKLSRDAILKMEKSRKLVEKWVESGEDDLWGDDWFW
jgi:histidine ammonia-lyase